MIKTEVCNGWTFWASAYNKILRILEPWNYIKESARHCGGGLRSQSATYIQTSQEQRCSMHCPVVELGLIFLLFTPSSLCAVTAFVRTGDCRVKHMPTMRFCILTNAHACTASSNRVYTCKSIPWLSNLCVTTSCDVIRNRAIYHDIDAR